MKRNYTTLHDIKDIVMIYGQPDNRCDWDDAEIMVYDPETKKEYDLIFCGSARPKEGHTILDDSGYGTINFVIREKKKDGSKEEK